jgi:tripartite-type tricarboxylate transporter receptor subunit TctC
VGSSAGASPDILARLIGGKMQESWGQSVVIDNRPGAGGIIGANVAAKSAPDGYTLYFASPAFAIRAALIPDLPYDSIKDFSSVTQIGHGNTVLVVGAGSGIKSVKELVALANANAGKFFFASPGAGTANYLNAVRFHQAVGIKAQHVGFKGESEALIEVAAGRAHFTSSSTAAYPLIQEGKLVALAQRFQHLPGVPLIADVAPAWTRHGSQVILTPAGVPITIRRKLSTEIGRILALPDIKNRLESMGFRITPSSPEEADRGLRADIETFTRLVKELGLRAK